MRKGSRVKRSIGGRRNTKKVDLGNWTNEHGACRSKVHKDSEKSGTESTNKVKEIEMERP